MPKNTKTTAMKLKEWAKSHKNDYLLGMELLQDEKFKQEFITRLVNSTFDTYKKQVEYEEALDYASK